MGYLQKLTDEQWAAIEQFAAAGADSESKSTWVLTRPGRSGWPATRLHRPADPALTQIAPD
jgi:hypothetical protein